MKRTLAGAAVLGVVLVSASACGAESDSGSSDSAPAKLVCVNRYVTLDLIDDMIKGLETGLASRGYSESDGSLKLDVRNPEGDAAAQQTIVAQFASEDCDVAVGVATPGAQAFLSEPNRPPVVFLSSSTPIEGGLVASLDAPGNRVTGVTDPQPVADEVAVATKFLPELKKVGIIWKPGDAAADVLFERAAEALEEQGLELVKAPITGAGETSQAASSLVGKVDAIELLGDSTTLAGIDGIMKVANDRKVPVFGGTSEAVAKGALFAGNFDFVHEGELGAGLVADILDGKDAGELPVVTVPVDRYQVSKDAVARLGITIPADVPTEQV